MVLKKLSTYWNSYKYRFVPWIAINLKNRSIRSVDGIGSDKIISDEELTFQLASLTRVLGETFPLRSNASVSPSEVSSTVAQQVMDHCLGFYVERCNSSVGGKGVFIRCLNSQSKGVKAGQSKGVKAGQIVGLYPGTLYLPLQPILFQSIGNPFIFRCLDRILLDGNDAKLSKMLFRSCSGRDRVGPFPLVDVSWLTPYPLNPLNIGQYVNNRGRGTGSNVAYQEFNLHPGVIPVEERRFLPTVWFSPPGGINIADIPIRIVALIATRNIDPDEELFSDYFTVIK